MTFFLWFSIILIVYAYFGYPILLLLVRPLFEKETAKGNYEPTVDIIIPAYNEEKVIEAKIKNTLALVYPYNKINVLVVSDASTDSTDKITSEYTEAGITFLRQEKRMGKAAALNLGLKHAKSEIVVFTDASILLARSALKKIVCPFKDVSIGCVSGEDHVDGGGGEGLYGRYELMIRNLESRCGSIVGASGCFYAQRRELCQPFKEGRAPDFISVLETVAKDRRAITESEALGLMGKVRTSGEEFNRKVRTLVRGMTALNDYLYLLNPIRYGYFAIALLSHKILRWSVGWLMILALILNAFLIGNPFYLLLFIMQIGFYTIALKGYMLEKAGHDKIGIIYRIPLFFCLSNLATVVAVIRFLRGIRQEIWESSKR